MKTFLFILLVVVFAGCNNHEELAKSSQLISDPNQQDSIFVNLATFVNKEYLDSVKTDSLSFLILPVEASCPSCRDKTVDSVLKHQGQLSHDQIIIISASKGKKTMSHFFQERGGELPVKPNIFLDSTNQAFSHNLFINNPAIYYAANGKAYKKVLTKPITIKQDLQEFFSK